MISYHAVAEFLGSLSHQAQVVSLYRELVGYAPLPMAGMLAAILEAIEQADLFPVHAYDVYDMREELSFGGLPPFQYYVHFDGLDMDDEWDFYAEPVHLVMALMEGCGRGDLYEHVYYEEARLWWSEYEADFDLPDLDSLDEERVIANLKEAAAAPWSGLWAIWQWIACNNENWFVDIPCSCQGELELDIDWNIADVRMLQREYAEAGKIFRPFGELVDLYRRAPVPTLGECFDLALAGCERPSVGSENEEVDEEVICE